MSHDPLLSVLGLVAIASAAIPATFAPTATRAAVAISPSALPSSPTTGALIVDSGDGNKLKVWNGSVWEVASGASVNSGNLTSTGVYLYTGMTITTPTTFTIPALKGWVVENTGVNATTPIITDVIYAGGTFAVTNILTQDFTFILLSKTGVISQQATLPTPLQRRSSIFLGQLVHYNRTSIQFVTNLTDYSQSPMAALRDMFTPIALINAGVTCAPNGVNLNFNTTAGDLYGMGVGWTIDPLAPNTTHVAAATAKVFTYATQTVSAVGTTALIDPTKYDAAGTITAISAIGDGNAHRATNQRIYQYPNGQIVIQYGQVVYDSLALASAAQQTESFTKFPGVGQGAAVLVGLLAVRRATTDLSDPVFARFTPASIFGESVGGVNGLATTTLQNAYNNSVTPEIVTDATLGAVSIKRGSAADTDYILEGMNGIGTVTFAVDGNGAILASGATIQAATAATLTLKGTSTGVGVNGILGSLDYYSSDLSAGASGVRGRIEVIDRTGQSLTNMIFYTTNASNATLVESLRLYPGSISGSPTATQVFLGNGSASFGGIVVTAAPTTASAGLRLPPGVAPTTGLTDGDVWTTTAGMYARINGVTVGPFGASGGVTTTGTPAANDHALFSASGTITNAAGIQAGSTFTSTAYSGGLLTQLVGGTFSTDISGYALQAQVITTSALTGTNRHDGLSGFITTNGTLASGAFTAGVKAINQGTPSGVTSGTYSGVHATVARLTDATTNSSTATFQGISSYISFGTSALSGTVAANLSGGGFNITTTNSGASGSATITAIYGLLVSPTMTTTAAGATTVASNYYGLYLGSYTLSGSGTNTITNRYGVYAADTAAINYFAGYIGGGIAGSSSSRLTLAASTTAISSLRITHGAAPTVPVNGDVWTTTAGMYAQINGVTVGPFGAAGTSLVSLTEAVVSGAYLLTHAPGTSTATTNTEVLKTSVTLSGNYVGVMRTLSATSTMTGTTGAAAEGYSVYGDTQVGTAATGGTLAIYAGVRGAASTVSTATLNMTAALLYGSMGTAEFKGAGISGTSLTLLAGSYAKAAVTMTGASGSTTISGVAQFLGDGGILSSATGGTTTITNYYGIYLTAPTISGAGTTTITNRYGVYAADASAINYFAGYIGGGIAGSTSSRLTLAASTTAISSLRVTHGAAPTVPVNGDVWTTTAGMYARINGATVGPFGAGAAPGGSTTQIQYNNAGAFGGASTLTYDSTAQSLTNAISNATVSPLVAAILSCDAIFTSGSSAMARVALQASVSSTGAAGTNTAGITAATFTATSSMLMSGTVKGILVSPITSNGATAVGSVYGVHVQATLSSPGTDYYGVAIAGTGTGAVTTAYGLYIGALGGTITTGYAIYQATATYTNLFSGLVSTSASTTTRSGLRVAHGTAPTSPVNGDVWTTTVGMYVQINGATVGPLGGGTVAGTAAANQIAYGSGVNTLTSSASLTFSTVSGALLLLHQGGTSTVTSGSTYALQSAIVLSGSFTGAGICSPTCIQGFMTASGTTNSGATEFNGGTFQSTGSGTLTAASIIGATGTGIATLGGVSTVQCYGLLGAGVVTSANNARFATSTLCGVYGRATFNSASTGSAQTATAVAAGIFQPFLITTNASGANSIPSVYGLWVKGVYFQGGWASAMTVNDYFGLRIDTAEVLSNTIITNYWGIYQAATTAVSFLAGPLITNSARYVKYQSVTSAAGTTVLGSADDFVCVTGTTTQTLTLPLLAVVNGVSAARVLMIKNRSTANVTVNRNSAPDTIDGGTTLTVLPNTAVMLVANYTTTDWTVF